MWLVGRLARPLSSITALEVIEALNLSFLLGCAFKYLWRADHKGSAADALEDLKKARSCLDREIARRERG